MPQANNIQVLIIPLWLLWRVQISRKQKLGLAGSLCLSVCMIIMAIARVSGIHYRDKFDNAWIVMWQQIEACVAVAMLSVTAFRSVFVASRPNVKNHKASPWVPSTRRLIGKSKKHNHGDHRRLDDLSVPSATITGLSRLDYPIDNTYSTENTSFRSSLNGTHEIATNV